MKKKIFGALLFIGLMLSHDSIIAQYIQQGQKLVGTGAIGPSEQGFAVSISGDGKTAIVGGSLDNKKGAAWIFINKNGTWEQQGLKLTGTQLPYSRKAFSVAISADGNTAILGDIDTNDGVGGAWIFVRINGVWSQQGPEIVGTGSVKQYAGSQIYQGISVALSSDGNTAIVGGSSDNGGVGATWVFTRSGGVWSQQGEKLVGSGAEGVNGVSQGQSVSISADGNTAIVGGNSDNGGVGATWVFTRSGGVWSQQGGKLVGTGAVGKAAQGGSVSLSADGNTAVVTGSRDNNNYGAVWVFNRTNEVWKQEGAKLVGTGATGAPITGRVSISSNGSTIVLGGTRDDSDRGAIWIFTLSGGVWTQLGSKLVGTGAVGNARQGTSVSISSDGNTVIVGGYYDNGHIGAAWIFSRTDVLAVDFISISANRSSSGVSINWKVAAEKDILNYDVQRSSDGQSFSKTGSTNANGESAYSWLDVAPLAGDAFYRVRSVGISGEKKYTKVVKVPSPNEQPLFTVSPNPVTGSELNVQFKSQNKGQYDISLTDASGTKVLATSAWHPSGNSTQTINLPSTISAGTYQLRIMTPGKTVTVKPVLIQRKK